MSLGVTKKQLKKVVEQFEKLGWKFDPESKNFEKGNVVLFAETKYPAGEFADKAVYADWCLQGNDPNGVDVFTEDLHKFVPGDDDEFFNSDEYDTPQRLMKAYDAMAESIAKGEFTVTPVEDRKGQW